MTRFEWTFYCAALSLVFVLMATSASAHDWERSEGHFRNTTDVQVSCYGDDKDHPGQVCRRTITRDQACFGDAIGAGDGDYVFKVPNRASFFVHGIEGLVVSPEDQLSWLMLDAAKTLRPGRYGWMTWSHFIHIMGDREVVACE